MEALEMGLRTNIELTVQFGQDNALVDPFYDRSFTQLLDTLDHGVSHVITMAAAETNFIVPFGDVAIARILYVEADGELNVTLGGAAATSAQIDAAGAVYPSTFVGAETLLLDIDNAGLFTVTFLVADQSIAQCINRINSYAAIEGIAPIAFNNAGQIRLTSPTTGTTSEVDIQGGTGRATLGFAVSVDNGTNSTPGTSPVTLQRPASIISGSNKAAGLSTYLLATANTSSIVLDNPDLTNAIRVRIAIAGDLS